MTYQLEYRVDPALARLSWLALLNPRTEQISVFCGTDVERQPTWLVEGVWDGDFQAGQFIRSQHFFGSGVHISGAAVRFVAANSMLDRLLYCHYNHDWVVSNSLPLMLAHTGARLDPEHDYLPESLGSALGIDAYPKTFRVLHPQLQQFGQLFYDTLVVQDGRISTERREHSTSFHNFEQYVGMLRDVLEQLRRNYESPQRRVAVRAFSTLSSGYDSPAVATLVRDLGVRTAYNSRTSNTKIPAWLARQIASDDGAPIANMLGLKTLPLDPINAHADPDDELFFLSATRQSPELIFHSMARDFRASPALQVLFTGYYGDAVWNVQPPPEYVDGTLHRGDSSGLALCEIRLRAGFFNVPLPVLFGRHSAAIAAISQSADMQPWRLGTRYDRPIPRRVVEEAGVPRHFFGMAKKAVAQEHDFPQTRLLLRRYRRDCHYSSLFLPTYSALNTLAFMAGRAWVYTRCRGDRMQARHTLTPRNLLWHSRDLRRRTFIWATDLLSTRLATVLAANTAGGAATIVPDSSKS